MKAKILPFITFILSILANISITAVPAKPGLIKMKQADGTEIKVRIIGDEHHHYYGSADFPGWRRKCQEYSVASLNMKNLLSPTPRN